MTAGFIRTRSATILHDIGGTGAELLDPHDIAHILALRHMRCKHNSPEGDKFSPDYGPHELATQKRCWQKTIEPAPLEMACGIEYILFRFIGNCVRSLPTPI